MSTDIADRIYPERQFGGFTRYDGTVHFCVRVQAVLGPTDVVLDVGCGRGKRIDDACEYRRNLQDFRAPRRRVIGIDVDRAAAANPYIDEFRLITDVDRWPVESESVHVAYCDYVLEHVEHPERFFAEGFRVLKPGGCLALRAPNALSYVALVSRVVPNARHAQVTAWAQRERKGQDVFPTFYRCNTVRKVRRALGRAGFARAVAYAVEAEPGYMSFSPVAYRCAAVVHRVLPPLFRTTLVAFARKGDGTRPGA